MTNGTIPGIHENPSDEELLAAGYRKITSDKPPQDCDNVLFDFALRCKQYAENPDVEAVIVGEGAGPRVLWARPKGTTTPEPPETTITRILSQDEQVELASHQLLLAALDMSQRGEIAGLIIVAFRKDGAFREMSTPMLNVNEKLGALWRLMQTMASAR